MHDSGLLNKSRLLVFKLKSMSEKDALFSKGPPRGIKRLFFRFPLLLFKAGLGPLFGQRFLKLTHTGRVSGLERETVLEVVKHDTETDT